MLAGSNHLYLLVYPDKTPSGYGVELGLLKDTNAYFEVYVKEVPEAVCSQIQAMAEGWRGLDTLWVNEDGKDCNKETNTMSFIFTDSLSRGTSGTRCTSDEGCTGCQTCQRGFCTDNNDSCPSDTPNCVSGQCQKCKAGFLYQNGSCRSCTNRYGYSYHTERSECLTCTNSFVPLEETGDDVTCFMCPGTVSADRTACDYHCPAGQYGLYRSASCADCTAEGNTYSTNATFKSECDKCKGIRFWRQKYSECYLCNTPNYMDGATREDCETCPNRYYTASGACHYCAAGVVIDVGGNRTCPTAECPEGEIWTSVGCQPCDTYETIYDAADCLTCAGRYTTNNGLICRWCNGTVSEDGTTCITE